LAEDGSLWISIDGREQAYLKLLLDEVCGRANYVATVVWQKRYSRENREVIGDAHEYVLVYAREPIKFKVVRNLLPLEEKQLKVYRNPNNDPKGAWRAVSLSAQGYRPNQMYEIVGPSGKSHRPPAGSCWKVIEPKYKELLSSGRIYFGKNGDAVPSRIQYLAEIEGIAPWTWWPHEEVGHTDEAKREVQELYGKEDSFATPKPERLLHRILHIATNPGDLVLDSFAGSGTTAAVAHKMGRRFVVVELGEHCHTHILPRLRKVVDGEDPGGITDAVGWKGGGGFRYYRLGPSLLEKDDWGNWIISEKYNAPMLAEALCKLEGFRFEPDPSTYFIHGRSSERDFLYATTQTLTFPQLERLSKDVGKKRSLLVMCGAFKATSAQLEALANLTVRKIPQAVLSRCEFGKDDYSLKLPEPSANEPEATDDASAEGSSGARTPKKKAKKTVPVQSLPLFDRQAAEKADKKGGRS
jgi:adenine-specific DNA-methyltransferase